MFDYSIMNSLFESTHSFTTGTMEGMKNGTTKDALIKAKPQVAICFYMIILIGIVVATDGFLSREYTTFNKLFFTKSIPPVYSSFPLVTIIPTF